LPASQQTALKFRTPGYLQCGNTVRFCQPTFRHCTPGFSYENAVLTIVSAESVKQKQTETGYRNQIIMKKVIVFNIYLGL
jgi:hypothetical protein